MQKILKLLGKKKPIANIAVTVNPEQKQETLKIMDSQKYSEGYDEGYDEGTYQDS